MALLASPLALGFSLTPLPAQHRRSSDVVMKGGLVPEGAFGGFRKLGGDAKANKWVGDRGQGEQVRKFEDGSDFLFFQGPAPKTAVQDDLPSFFSFDNLKDTSISPLALPVAATGAAS